MSLLVSLAFLEQALVGVEDWWIVLTDQSHEGRYTWRVVCTEIRKV